jgi:ceramide glucosyltransferase
MFHFLLGLALLGLLASSVVAGIVLAAVPDYLTERATAILSQRGRQPFTPPLSLLKPLHGAEPGLAEYLASFYQQDYPTYEVIFCARDQKDPGLEIAWKVAARYPKIPTQFHFTGGQPPYINDKVISLETMEAAAAHEILVISDSDVRVSPGYLRAVAQPFEDDAVGAVTCPYRGIAAQGGLWARLEAVGMSVEMNAGVLAARAVEGMQFVLGPTMAFRREAIRRIGGFRLTANFCADDFVLGNAVYKLGMKVVLSHHAIDHMVINSGFVSTLKHQVRWMKSTRFSRPLGHLGTALTFSIPYGLLAWIAAAALGHPWAGLLCFAWALATRFALAVAVGNFVIGDPGWLDLLALYPLRDLMGFGFWAASYFSSRILWRDRVYRLLPGGRMRAAE